MTNYHDNGYLCDSKIFKVPLVDFLFLAEFNEVRLQYDEGILPPLLNILIRENFLPILNMNPEG